MNSFGKTDRDAKIIYTYPRPAAAVIAIVNSSNKPESPLPGALMFVEAGEGPRPLGGRCRGSVSS